MPLRTVVQAVPQRPCRGIGNRPKIGRPSDADSQPLCRPTTTTRAVPAGLIGVLVVLARVCTDETVRGTPPLLLVLASVVRRGMA